MAIEITADNIRKNTEEKDKMADNQTKTDNKKKKKQDQTGKHNDRIAHFHGEENQNKVRSNVATTGLD